MCRKATGNKNTEAAKILNAPTSPEESDTNPFFISIKELPQIRDSNINKNQASASCLFFKGRIG
jgi:hypothetical protein